jgi:hypothetical protein
MFARLTVYENVDLDLADRVTQFMETLETDPFGELPGYRGSMTLVDRDNARLVGIGFYASAGHAKEADALLATTWYEAVADQVPATIRPALEMRPDTVGLYEIVQRDGDRHVPLVRAIARVPVRARRRAARLLAAGRQGDRRCGEAPQIEATCLSTHDRRRCQPLDRERSTGSVAISQQAELPAATPVQTPREEYPCP